MVEGTGLENQRWQHPQVRILSFPPRFSNFEKMCYNVGMARKFKMRPVAKQNRNNNHKHSDKRKHPRLKDGR